MHECRIPTFSGCPPSPWGSARIIPLPPRGGAQVSSASLRIAEPSETARADGFGCLARDTAFGRFRDRVAVSFLAPTRG